MLGNLDYRSNVLRRAFLCSKKFIEDLPDDSQAIIEGKSLFQSESLVGTLASIVHNFGKLPGLIEKLQSDGAQLTEQITIVENIQSSLPQSSAPAAKLQAVLNKNTGYQCPSTNSSCFEWHLGRSFKMPRTVSNRNNHFETCTSYFCIGGAKF